MAQLSFWYEFASPYAYLSAHRIADVAKAHGVTLHWRPFLLGPIFQAQGWPDSPFNIYPAKGIYLWQDTAREAAKLSLPKIVKPDPFPQHSLLAARVATLGAAQGWGPAFSRAVYRAEFAEGQRIDDPQVLTALLNDLGQDGASLVNHASTDPETKAALRQTVEEAMRLNIFGAPSFTCEDGTLFWGNDRLEDAVKWASQVGAPSV